MLTQCPNCRTLYRLHGGLVKTQGAVACVQCKYVFDCLQSLLATPNTQADSSEIALNEANRRFILAGRGIPLAKPYQAISSEPRPELLKTQPLPPRLALDALVETPELGYPLKRLVRSIGGFFTGVLGLALRNLLRNRRRSLFAFSAIGFGVIAVILAGGFIEWVLWAMRESAIEAQLGHVQIVRPGYFKDGQADPFEYLLPGQSVHLATLEKLSMVKVIAPRLYFTGLLSKGDTTVSFLGQGVDPTKERVMNGTSLKVNVGHDLDNAHPNEIILGVGLAENIGAKPGDAVVLLTNISAAGGINAVDAKVAGIFSTPVKAFDDSALRVPIALARTLTKTAGSHVWVVMLQHTFQTQAALNVIKSDLENEAKKFEFIPWYELEAADFYNKAEQLFSQQVALIWLVIGLLILLSISNTLTMSVMERTSEIGTLMAMGSRRSVILKLFLAEGLLLGVIGGTIGLVIALLLAKIISTIGIPMPPAPGSTEGYSGAIMVTNGLMLGALMLAASVATIAAVYPAYKASRMEIVNALRHNR